MNGFDSGRWRSGSLGSSLMRCRIGIRDPDEHVVGARRCAAQVFQMSVVEGLEAPVNHPDGSLDDDSGALLHAADPAG